MLFTLVYLPLIKIKKSFLPRDSKIPRLIADPGKERANKVVWSLKRLIWSSELARDEIRGVKQKADHLVIN